MGGTKIGKRYTQRITLNQADSTPEHLLQNAGIHALEPVQITRGRAVGRGVRMAARAVAGK